MMTIVIWTDSDSQLFQSPQLALYNRTALAVASQRLITPEYFRVKPKLIIDYTISREKEREGEGGRKETQFSAIDLISRPTKLEEIGLI